MRFHPLAIAAIGLALSLTATPSRAIAAGINNIVIVHGAFADGSGWRKVSDILAGEGYNVSIVQQPLTSLQDDVAATRRVLSLQDGPTVLVGHSYGGMVISDAGNDGKVAALVYVAAFQPEKGETLAGLAESKPDPSMQPGAVRATADGYLYLDPKAFAAAFAADLPEADADFFARSQVFASKAAFTAAAGEPAWKVKPSWALIATQDRSINPALERDMAKRAGSKIREVKRATRSISQSRRPSPRLLSRPLNRFRNRPDRQQHRIRLVSTRRRSPMRGMRAAKPLVRPAAQMPKPAG